MWGLRIDNFFFSKLDEHAQRLERKCFENQGDFYKQVYISVNFLCILLLLPGTSFKDFNEHIPGIRILKAELCGHVFANPNLLT
jgi:hypothetical protein